MRSTCNHNLDIKAEIHLCPVHKRKLNFLGNWHIVIRIWFSFSHNLKLWIYFLKRYDHTHQFGKMTRFLFHTFLYSTSMIIKALFPFWFTKTLNVTVNGMLIKIQRSIPKRSWQAAISAMGHIKLTRDMVTLYLILRR